MAILCYVTGQIQSDASTHGVPIDKLDQFAKQVEKSQSLAKFDHFPPPCLTVKKIFGYSYRMIAVEKKVGENLVVVLLRLLVRGGNEYGPFLRDPAAWAKRSYADELDDQTLEDWVRERTKVAPPEPPPMLLEAEETFLWTNAYGELGEDVLVCESEEWVRQVSEPRIADRLILLPEVISEAVGRPAGALHVVRPKKDDRLAILVFNTVDAKHCALLSVTYGESEEESSSRASRWITKIGNADPDTILRHSRRSYPSLICSDDDLWMTVQRDPQANLALSPEEAEILAASQLQEASAPAFPLFINGRAGSGKSTLLQYLFSECFLRWATHFTDTAAEGSQPLYIASSRELLKVAKDVVQSLLSANYQHLLASQPVDEARLDGLDACFQEFIRFLRSTLDASERTRFSWSAYVGYARFRRMWTDRFGKEKKAVRQYGPQISWHVIRGFIKGMSVDGLLARDDYEELPQDERTVSHEVYDLVHDRVWTAWYKPLCERGEVWDSQDIVRHLLESDRLPASHVAIFCDEAQDFTRIELEAIYQCSLFSKRQIDFRSLKRVPFVFAGDPFQTLNPTGFRWESVRAAFTERIIRSLYRFNTRNETPPLNYRELTFNYRSSPRLVHLCNSIQAVRACILGHRSLRPQSTWQLGGDTSSPMFFEKGDTQVDAVLREQSDLVLIVPCEEGEEVEYVLADPYLKGIVQADEDGTPRNVLSAARAKGLEFLRVALYGWASRDEAAVLAKRIQSPGADVMTIDERLGMEYFLNNLYVAASRAHRRLFVIDEKGSRDTLWSFASDEQCLSNVVRHLPESQLWQLNTGLLVQGVPESFREDRDDPCAIAERFEREGLSKEDSYLLKQAGLQYQLAENVMKANECRAMAAIFDGRYRDAGESFLKAGLVERAIDAYWKGRHHRNIADCAGTYPDFARLPRCRVSCFIEGGSQTVRECRSLLEHLLENSKTNKELQSDLRSVLWKESLQEAVRNSLAKQENTRVVLSTLEAGHVVDLLLQLESLGLQLDGQQAARLFFTAERYEDVLKRLVRDDGSDLYRDAKASALIAQSSTAQHHYNASDSRIIADYHFRHKRFEIASRFYEGIHDSVRLIECLNQAVRQKGQAVPAPILENMLTTLVANAEWEALVSLVSSGQPQPSQRGRWTGDVCMAILHCIQQHHITYRIVVPALARSVELVNTEGKRQQPISELLANELVRVGPSAVWPKYVSRKEAGAAIERAGRDIDALKFYENWHNLSNSQHERDYSERRWVVCKLRQAKREERAGMEKKAFAYEQEAERVMQKRGWSEVDVPDTFPEIVEVSSLQQRPTSDGARLLSAKDGAVDSRGQLGGLSYRVIASKEWINIEADDGLCARVFVAERKVTSDDIRVNALDVDRFECQEWGLVIQWISNGEVQFNLRATERRIRVG